MSEQIISTTVEPVAQPVVELTNEPSTQGEPNVASTPAQQPAPQATPQAAPQVTAEQALATADKAALMKLPAVQGILEDARQQEKDKLYKSMTDKDDTIKQLKDKVSDLENQVKAKEDTEMEAEKELLAQIQALKEGQEGMLKQLAAKDAEAAQAKLDAFKEKAIAGAEGKLVVSLVKGETEEEITASVEAAKAEYENIVSPYRQQAEEAAKPNVANAPRTSNPATGGAPTELTSAQIKAMTPAEYQKHREALLASIR